MERKILWFFLFSARLLVFFFSFTPSILLLRKFHYGPAFICEVFVGDFARNDFFSPFKKIFFGLQKNNWRFGT